MHWLSFVLGAVLSWGVYGSMLHDGQGKLGSPMRALLCVGIAYFLIGVLVPLAVLLLAGAGPARIHDRGHDDGDGCGGARRHRRGLHHLRVPDRRHSDLRDAARVRWRTARQCPLHDVPSPAGARSESASVCRLPRHRGQAPAWCCTSSRPPIKRRAPE